MPKRAAGPLLPALIDEPAALRGRRAQIYRTVVEQIRTGHLAPGDRLPSARQLAREWQVARGVVDEAFAQLQAEGLLERRVGDGSYVRRGAKLAELPVPPTLAPEANPAARRRLEQQAPYMAMSRAFEIPRNQFHPPVLHPRAWPEEAFPLERWRRLVASALQEEWRDHLGYGPTAGLPTLRSAIARHLALTRGLNCSAEQVLVVNGPQQALEVLARVVLKPGDEVWVEDPGHPSLPLLFEMLHCRSIGVPVDDHGFDVDAAIAKAPGARLAYLHPLSQFPLGSPTSRERGERLLAWAEESNAWVVEGCFNDEIVHRQPAPPALMSRDRAGRVLLIGTFEGIVFPSLRLGYLVVPERMADVFIAARSPLGDHSPVVTQLALEAFMDSGELHAHLRALRELLAPRREALRQALRRHMPAEVWHGRMDTAWHACLHLPPGWSDHALQRALYPRGIGVDTLSARCWQVEGYNGIVVSYAAWTPAVIDQAVRTIAEVIDALFVQQQAPPAHAAAAPPQA